MDTIIQALIMGIVQGLTEFLPISSSGHLIIVPFLFGWTDPFITSLAFSVMLHIGTLAALLVYFRADWIRLVPAGFAAIRDRSFRADPDRRLAWLLVAATIPAAIAGLPAQRRDRDRVPRHRTGGCHARRRGRRSCGWPTAGAAAPRASTTSRSRSPSRSARPRRWRSSRASAGPASRSRPPASPGSTARPRLASRS